MKLLDAPPVEPLGPLLALVAPALKIRSLGAEDLTGINPGPSDVRGGLDA